MESTTPKLPNDVIVEILTWLPLMSLLKFKCVCRSWFSLISTRHFAMSHLRKSRQDLASSSHRIILNCRGGTLKHCSLPSILRDPAAEAFDTDYSSPFAGDFVWVVGSCDGLVCLAVNRKHLILWNPSTRIRKQLPDSGVDISFRSYVTYGFGHDEASDDYKVVFFNINSHLSEAVAKVYCVRNDDEWRSLESCSSSSLTDDPASFVHGKLHWMTTSDKDIVFVDLATEESGTLKLPSYVRIEHYSRLGASEGSLIVLCSNQTHADVWIMDYEASALSWTKAASIPCLDDFLRFSYKRVLYVLKDGVVVLDCGPRIVIFDLKNGSVRDVELRNCNGGLRASLLYIESLVSPVSFRMNV
ncbi:F-box/kelch-repeat protein At3g23880-like [Andrographis paniculata]|uniref:F-box/kelch-repeat protein At3g23880-like n=1 Tax=Andrographis paniculata TaxID=175694 RepID=UPI0021E7FBA9|nr:F-box/kelch-repeat protein At3g23880-like [Andrographis paniculata]